MYFLPLNIVAFLNARARHARDYVSHGPLGGLKSFLRQTSHCPELLGDDGITDKSFPADLATKWPGSSTSR